MKPIILALLFVSAEQGDAKAQYNLGVCYENGHGVPQDYSKAVEWYRKSAEQGHAAAQYNLGVCYYNGIGVPKNTKKAMVWLRRAARLGDESAQWALNNRLLMVMHS